MRAWQVKDATGGLEKTMRLNEVEQPPAPKRGQLLVKVLAAGINPADHKLPEQFPRLSRLAFGTPLTVGLDYCGTIEALPSGDAHGMHKGQLVMGRTDMPSKYGPLAEHALVPVGGCVPVPAGLSPLHAASVGTCAATAYSAIAPYVTTGSRVFINGGSGGTGVYSIQIAKALGCHVVVSCSATNAQLCTDLGADATIDYRSTDLGSTLEAMGPVFDLVVDNVGHRIALHAESVKFLKPTGTFVLVGAPTHDMIKGIRSMLSSWLRPAWLGGVPRRWKFLILTNQRNDLLQITQWFADGKLRAVIDSEFAFEDAKQAYVKLKTGRARGKIVVQVDSSTHNGN